MIDWKKYDEDADVEIFESYLCKIKNNVDILTYVGDGDWGRLIIGSISGKPYNYFDVTYHLIPCQLTPDYYCSIEDAKRSIEKEEIQIIQKARKKFRASFFFTSYRFDFVHILFRIFFSLDYRPEL